MKIVVYGPDKRTGVLNGDLIIDIGGAIEKHSNPPTGKLCNLETLIEGGKAALEEEGDKAEENEAASRT